MTWSVRKLSKFTPKAGECKLPHVLCIESVFPKTNTFIMSIKDGKIFTNKKMPKGFIIQGFDYVTDLQPWNIGTQGTAPGDSGTGHWMMNYEDDPPRAFLVAISTWGVVSPSESQTGLVSAEQKTTNKHILSFIKAALVHFDEM